ncbi:hypothetical protein M427DRAFT_56733 [Gonapodya prolifera JEL478]|uniref:Uncharacterized protein n=1 Tax=Gonapodya prolifera (strain JEL478) TaxID=1344416 RepID=A0A139AEY7_GONPJ|nr:hypothetical protein M427DRAFT_56733 [Gonapodya prolifera JEL478]|eukprot:KXS15371.1 hypothetical protein M427DRAFT_56733 [Gonapodya prolifera JEL478]
MAAERTLGRLHADHHRSRFHSSLVSSLTAMPVADSPSDFSPTFASNTFTTPIFP